MPQSFGDRKLLMRRVVAALFAAGPFVAGVVAALSARRDLRLLAMALIATLVARIVLAAIRHRARAFAGGVAFAGGTVAAGVTAVLAGARGMFGVVAVAVVLAAFATIGALLATSPPSERSTQPNAVV
jgi:hypothetical protein